MLEWPWITIHVRHCDPGLTGALTEQMGETVTMSLAANMPLLDTGGEPGFVRDFAQAAEDLGYDGLALPDHVLGANIANRPDWGDRNTSADFFHDPFVLFGFLAACTTTVEFSTQVMILPQRQTALVAKQAASLDVLSGGRFRFGIGSGWNPIEYEALGEDFKQRGRRLTEQVEVMRQLWAEPHVTFSGDHHEIDDAGINPLPTRGSIPLWFGGHEERMLRRIAKLADGWMMLAFAPDETALEAFDNLRGYIREEGRDPADVGIEVWASVGDGDDEKLRADVQFWKDAGVTHITLNNWYNRPPHKRMVERTADAHIAAMQHYRELVADLL
jgi:probable F420-dependent oxidoreductase